MYKSVKELYNNTSWEYKVCMWIYKDYLEWKYPDVIFGIKSQICDAICAKCCLEIDDNCDLCYWNTYEENTNKKD